MTTPSSHVTSFVQTDNPHLGLQTIIPVKPAVHAAKPSSVPRDTVSRRTRLAGAFEHVTSMRSIASEKATTFTGILFVFTFLFCTSASAQGWKLLFGLRGEWKFEIGDDPRRANPNYDDSKWETVYAPANWEDEGFPGYDGYAWYRKHFQTRADWKGKAIFLRLGRIDDVDEVYVNGKLIGATGMFPPEYETAYNLERDYEIPISYLNIPGDNVIAVRVFDDQLEGGILDGKLGVYEDGNALIPELPLAGEWMFRTGDNPSWKDRDIVDGDASIRAELPPKGKSGEGSQWRTIHVPRYWEYQNTGVAGNREYEGYDGYAWYRLRFTVPKEFAGKRMVLLLGKIDDHDETYLNGKLIGKTGKMRGDVIGADDWQKLRAYTLAPEQLRAGQENVVAVRVYDGFRGGGIYAGPIGLVSRERYIAWKKMNEGFDFLDRIFEKLK